MHSAKVALHVLLAYLSNSVPKTWWFSWTKLASLKHLALPTPDHKYPQTSKVADNGTWFHDSFCWSTKLRCVAAASQFAGWGVFKCVCVCVCLFVWLRKFRKPLFYIIDDRVQLSQDLWLSVCFGEHAFHNCPFSDEDAWEVVLKSDSSSQSNTSLWRMIANFANCPKHSRHGRVWLLQHN